MEKTTKIKVGLAVGLLVVALALVAWNMTRGSGGGDNPAETTANKQLDNARPGGIN